MPQMSPIWWTTLFIEINCLMMISNSLIYFIKEIKNKKKTTKKKPEMKWSW